jgi:uncharacterized NAD(P)/FAD-binding protein YdhS
MKKVLIVGGGASGLLVAINVARLSREPISVSIAEPQLFLGRGVAYGTQDSNHLLNVPAGRMSALVDDPDHFCKWGNFDPNYFAPRSEYGKYLLATFVSTQLEHSYASFEHLQDSVDEISRSKEGFQVQFKDSDSQLFDVVVLALGQGRAIKHPVLETFKGNPHVINDAWRDSIAEFEGTLACVGTGLTFIDHALSHLRKSPRNRVIGISRNGLLPEKHLPKRAAPLEVPNEARQSPHAMRAFIENATDWRAAQDGIRHELPDIWHSWDEAKKSEFLNKDLRWWNVHRHRVSPEIHHELDTALSEGRITIVKDEVVALQEVSGHLSISTRTSGNLAAKAIVNCLGYEAPGGGTLIEKLSAASLVSPGPLQLGVSTNYPNHTVLNSEGKNVEGLFAIGPILLGERFETTAIPELRVQAKDVATAIV